MLSTKMNTWEFSPLNVSGDNYLQWALDIKISLKSKDLGDTIVVNNKASEKQRYKAIQCIRHHLAESLKNQYLTIENPLDLWNELRERYDHQKTILLPKARNEWKELRIQDFKSVDQYNSAMFKIVSLLRLCGDTITEGDMLEKTFSTFHTSNVLLQQQYRAKEFTTYSSLISCLLLAEQNNELLMINSEKRPPGSTPLPEAHTVTETDPEANHVHHGKPSGRGRGGWRGRGRGSHRSGGRGQGSQQSHGRSFGRGHGRGRGSSFKPPHSNAPTKSACHRCGMTNHWAKNCRTPKHLVELYQESIKGKRPEAHMVVNDDENDFTQERDDSMDYETSDILKD